MVWEPQPCLPRLLFSWVRSLQRGQQQPEGRAEPGLADDIHRAPALSNDAVHDRETEAGSPVGRLRREKHPHRFERLEHLFRLILARPPQHKASRWFTLSSPQGADRRFAVISEELGLIGAAFVVLLFGVFGYRGIRAAFRTGDPYGRFLGVGITSMVILQAFFNISVVLGLLPTKGIPLPFVSYGGTSVFFTLAAVGILLNITQHAD